MAKLRPVKCPGCGKTFRREDEEFEEYKKRYWHKSCYEKEKAKELAKKKQKEYELKIHEKMKQVCGAEYNNKKIEQQLKQYTSEGKTPQQIYFTLNYWYDIKKESADKANGGIGIVPFIIKESEEYWRNKRLQYERDMNIKDDEVQKVLNFRNQKRETDEKRRPIQKPKRSTLFTLD